MILFEEDWFKYPTAIPHVTTKNESFLRMAALFRDEGVTNHNFLLALHNPELEHVDPRDPDLTKEQIEMIVIECYENFWYFIREVVKIPSKAGDTHIRFKANRGNISLYWLFFNHITNILIQIRQTGKTLGTVILLRYLLNIKSRNSYMCLITKDESLRAKTIEDLKSVEEELPFYLTLSGKGDARNTEAVTVNVFGNKLRGFIASASPKMALALGRGLTTPIVWFDEASYLKNIELTLPTALSAGSAARDEAKTNDSAYGTIISTTAGKKDDRDGRYIYDMLSNSALWTEKFYDAANKTELGKQIRKNSPGGTLRVNSTFSHTQLGFTDEWLRTTMEESEVHGEQADRDFFNVWTDGGLSSPLPTASLRVIRESQVDANHSIIDPTHGYMINWYVSPDKRLELCRSGMLGMGLDTSDAMGNDDIGMIILDLKNGATVATGIYNETNLISFAEYLLHLLITAPAITLMPERQSSAVVIIDYLTKMLIAKDINPLTRIFNWIVDDLDSNPRDKDLLTNFRSPEVREYITHSAGKKIGFRTSGTGKTSRTMLYSTVLSNAVRYSGDRVRDAVLIDQLLGLTTRNGRLDHQLGGNDDAVIAWLMVQWFIFTAKNLTYYGIDPNLILTDNSNLTAAKTEHNSHDSQLIRRNIAEAQELVTRINESRNSLLTDRYVRRLAAITRETPTFTNNVASADAIMSSLKKNTRVDTLVKKYISPTD